MYAAPVVAQSLCCSCVTFVGPRVRVLELLHPDWLPCPLQPSPMRGQNTSSANIRLAGIVIDISDVWIESIALMMPLLVRSAVDPQ